MNVIEAIRDEHLFRPFLVDLESWRNWLLALRALYGIKINATPYTKDLIQKCTGRALDKLPKDGFSTALLLVGRRGGKSRISGLVAAYEACLSGREKKLAKGEWGLVSVVSPTRFQSQIIKRYIRAAFETDLLQQEIVDDGNDGFELSNGVRIQILTGDFKSVRGFTQLCVIVDEICFMGLTEESKVRNDSELIQAIRPALITTRGKLIAISTKYSPKGWAYRTWKNNFDDNGRILVWDAISKQMNPTLSDEVIAEAMAEDPVAARTEFLNQWREDVGAYLPREAIEAVVVKNRKELLPRENILYYGFTDVSGGRGDDATLAIGHLNEYKKVVVDYLKRWKPPFNPQAVIRLMCDELRRYGLSGVVGDAYAAEFTVQSFRACGIAYKKSEKNKSELYLNLLPRICSAGIELLDDEILVSQLANLERRCRSGGKDIIDHPSNGRDDLANAVAGLGDITTKRKIIAGAF